MQGRCMLGRYLILPSRRSRSTYSCKNTRIPLSAKERLFLYGVRRSRGPSSTNRHEALPNNFVYTFIELRTQAPRHASHVFVEHVRRTGVDLEFQR